MKKFKTVRLLTAPEIQKNLERMGREILRQNKASDSLAFIGIRTRGLYLRQRRHADWQTKRYLWAKWTLVYIETISTR